MVGLCILSKFSTWLQKHHFKITNLKLWKRKSSLEAISSFKLSMVFYKNLELATKILKLLVRKATN